MAALQAFPSITLKFLNVAKWHIAVDRQVTMAAGDTSVGSIPLWTQRTGGTVEGNSSTFFSGNLLVILLRANPASPLYNAGRAVLP
jgi:hypothetical protein